MTSRFRRDRLTWLSYLLVALYGYSLNSLGPITPFLQGELSLSYTVSSLHFTAFAVGIVIVGFVGNFAIGRLGQMRAIWIGAFGISVGAVGLVAARSVLITIAASFCMGLVGSLILAAVPSLLSDRHGELRSVALSEANVTASLVSSVAPLMVGWAARLPGGWRWALGIAALAPFVALPWLGKTSAYGREPQPVDPTLGTPRLPGLYWLFWVALFLGVSIEFCMVSWSAGYVAATLGMSKADAAQTVSLFLAGMVVGRLAGSRLVRRFSAHQVVVASIGVATLGFCLFWAVLDVTVALVGLFLIGLGIASLYPLLLSLAIGSVRNSVQASSRATLASGTAILILPLVLGRLADAVGIRLAYGVVAVLLIGIFLIVMISRQTRRSG